MGPSTNPAGFQGLDSSHTGKLVLAVRRRLDLAWQPFQQTVERLTGPIEVCALALTLHQLHRLTLALDYAESRRRSSIHTALLHLQ